MAEIKEKKGMMSQQENSEDGSFIDNILPETDAGKKALRSAIKDAAITFSTAFGSTANQIGAMQAQKEIEDERYNAAVEIANQEIAVVGAENKKRAKELKEINKRKKLAQNNASTFFSNPMYKTAKNKIIASGKMTLEEFNALEEDPDLQASLGRKFGELTRSMDLPSAAATLINGMYEAKDDPKVKLFAKFKVPFIKEIKPTLDQQTEQALSKPKSLFENIDANRPENLPRQISSKVTLDPDYKESAMTETGKVFPVLDGSGAFRLERSVNNLIAANAGLVISYPDGDRSTRAVLTAEGGKGKDNDIKTGTKAMELARSMINSGYSETDTDILYRDLSLILQNAAPRNKESKTEQKDFEKRVDQIKLELSRIDNRFERRERIEQLKKGEELNELLTGGGKGKEDKPVSNNLSILSSALGTKLRTVTGDAGSYLLRNHESDPNIKQVDKNNYNIIVKKDTDQYKAGTVLSVELEFGNAIAITDTGQKTEALPEKLGTGRLYERKQQKQRRSLAPKPKEEKPFVKRNRRNRRNR